MRFLTFTVFNVIGGCAWVATWVTIGDVAGDHIDTIYADINRYSLYAFGALAVLLAVYIAWRVTRRRRGGRATAGGEAERDAVAPARSDAQGS
jgi:membrane protein DedA with SNARE-associated domain